VDKFNAQTATIPAKSKWEFGEFSDDSGKIVPLPDYELEDLQRELAKIGTGIDEDLDVRVYFILSYSSNRVREFLEGAALITNTNEPRKLKALFIPTVKMLPEKSINANKIQKNLKRISLVCKYYADPRFTPHFLSFAGAFYHLIGEDRKAVRLLEQIIEDYPTFQYASLIKCATGILYEEFLRRPSKAAKAYQSILDNYPKSLEAEAAQQGLARLGR